VKVSLKTEALQDLRDSAASYEDREPGLGEEFLAEVQRSLSLISNTPEVWPLWPGARRGQRSIHRFLLSRFPYAIAYQTLGDSLVILAIAPHRKRPRYWADRAR